MHCFEAANTGDYSNSESFDVEGGEHLSVGRNNICVYFDQTLKCVGDNSLSEEPIEFGVSANLAKIAVGYSNVCVLQEGNIECFGSLL